MSEFPTITIDDALISVVLAALSKTDGQVDAGFDVIAERLRSEKTRVAAETQEINPAMASTPLGGERGAVNRAEAALYKERQAMFAAVRTAAIAFMTFREREEELAHKRRRFVEQEDAKERQRKDGLYDEAVVLSDRLHAHGVHRSYLRINEDVTAILADLILWFADDTQFANPSSPWPTIIAMYANRSVLKPTERLAQKDHRSRPVAAPAHTNPREPDPYYRYGASLASSAATNASPIAMVAISADPSDTRADWPIRDRATPARDEVITSGEPPADAVLRADRPDHESPGGVPNIDTAAVPAIAAALYDSDPGRRGWLWAGLEIAEGTTAGASLIAALEKRLAGIETRDDDLKRFLGAARQGGGEKFVAVYRNKKIAQIESQIHEGNHELIEEARAAGLL